jgi:hypothetical protein
MLVVKDSLKGCRNKLPIIMNARGFESGQDLNMILGVPSHKLYEMPAVIASSVNLNYHCKK